MQLLESPYPSPPIHSTFHQNSISIPNAVPHSKALKSTTYLRPVGQARLKAPRLSKSPKLHSIETPLPGRSLLSPKSKSQLLSPCHICHRRPTTTLVLDSFADCAHCGSRTCYVCLRQCEGLLCGQRKMVCSQCSVERGEDGVVSCLDCLESEFRGPATKIEHLQVSGLGEGEGGMGRTVDWVIRQQQLRGL